MNSSIDMNPVIDRKTIDLQTRVSDSVDAFIAGLPERMRKGYEEYDGEGRREFIEREMAFVDQVLTATTELAESRTGPITILFDVDDTIARNVYGEGNEITTYVRPGLTILMERLEESVGDRLDVGLLTSRAESHLVQEMASPTYLSAMKDKVNSDFIFSSREGSSVYNHEALAQAPHGLDMGMESVALRAIEKIIRPDMKAHAEAGDYDSVERSVDRCHWYDAKLAILQHVADQNPDRGFVFVDDLPFPASVDPSHGQVRGVSLHKARFSL
jgi:hypothetical protein